MLLDLKSWLSDFVPYSIDSWIGLLQHYHQVYWPFNLLAIAASAAMLMLAHRQTFASQRFALWLLCCCWLWCGLVFHQQYFRTLSWAAGYFGWVFVAQAILLTLYSVFHHAKTKHRAISAKPADHIVLLIGFIAMPVLQLVQGHPLNALGWLALTPDATALSTLALLGYFKLGKPLLIILPLGWSLFSFGSGWPASYLPAMAQLAVAVSITIWFSPRPKFRSAR